MSEAETTEPKANRILVTLDTSARGRAALEAAVRLALKTRAELQGLYVEDEDLVHLASLPFAREVDFASALSRQMHSANMERALRAAAEQAQQAFAKALGQLDLSWTFRIVRGAVTQASLAAVADEDLLVIGQQGRFPRAVAGDYFPRRRKDSGRVVAVFDGSPSAFRAIELAGNLAEQNSHVLTVLVLADDAEEVAQRCLAWLQQHGIPAEVNQMLSVSQNAIIDYVRKWLPGVLLINRDSGFISDSLIHRLVNEFDCPLVLC